MRTAHLFAGAGGGILADLILGHTPVWAVEWDAYACSVLRARFPGLHVIDGDVRGVDFRGLARVDALCAGFPCTDISAANPGGKGIDGERSGLYREVMRAIDHLRPAWVFLENSPRIRTKGRHVVIGDLVARGYSWRDGILAAADVGAPHQRDRWWCLARRAAADADRDQCASGAAIDGGRDEPGAATAADGGHDLADADRIGSQRGDLPWPRKPQIKYGGQAIPNASGDGPKDALSRSIAGSAAREAFEAVARRDQRPGWFETEPPVGRVVDGLAAGAHGNWASRIKALGNGQVPLCAAVAWRLLGGPSNT